VRDCSEGTLTQAAPEASPRRERELQRAGKSETGRPAFRLAREPGADRARQCWRNCPLSVRTTDGVQPPGGEDRDFAMLAARPAFSWLKTEVSDELILIPDVRHRPGADARFWRCVSASQAGQAGIRAP